MKAKLVTGLAVLTLSALTACGSNPDDPAETELHVFAAASLTETFTELAHDFEVEHPGVTVVTNFAGSSALANQINNGAVADVFASAAPTNMDTVVDAGNAADDPVVFARNRLVIAVPADNPHNITGLADLADPDLTVALCAVEVPCGAAAETALAAGAVELTPVTLEQNVKAALSKVTLGEVDAAVVYRTDVRTTGADITGIEFGESAEAVNDYPIVRLTGSAHPDLADQFIDHVRSAAGRETLTAAGFGIR